MHGTDEHVGFLAGDLQTTLDQKIKERRGFEAAGFTDVKVVKDLSDRDRVITNGPDPRTNPIPKM